MNRVFILGAGASRELKFKTTIRDVDPKKEREVLHSVGGPLSSGFFYYINDFINEIN